ncbi:MAG: hypothetical protein KGY80_05915 [Candidatus Thorarchaeota archaeon]|nr:hypothetical protein [Candidatus Thorarchaeota archaeon]
MFFRSSKKVLIVRKEDISRGANISWRKSNNSVDDTVLRVYVKSSKAAMSQDEYNAVERIKQSDGSSQSEKMAAIGLSFVEQSIMKYAGDTGI